MTEQNVKAFTSVDVFTDFLLGLHFRKRSGTVMSESDGGLKKLFFRDGELVFASSESFDDRLGEVAYRRGMVTLDQLTESATKVMHSRRWGQVVVRAKIMSDFDLWIALKEQVKQIAQSFFLAETLNFEMAEFESVASEVAFPDSSEQVIEACYGYGSAFRSFVSTLKPSSWIKMLNADYAEPGSFAKDLIDMIGGKILVDELTNQSKLNRLYTLSALMDLANRGVCSIEDTKNRTFDERSPRLLPVRKLLKAQETVIKLARKAFEDEKTLFPLDDLKRLVQSFSVEVPDFFLDASGNINPDSVASILNQSFHMRGRAEFFEIRVRALIEFLLQVTGDHLSDQHVKRLRSSIQEYYS
jgi:hypothetical protein